MLANVTKTTYLGWNNYPCYHVRTYQEYRIVSKWMQENHCEEFVLSSGSGGYTFQVRSNHEWFLLRWAQ